jgi:hypothetical protein
MLIMEFLNPVYLVFSNGESESFSIYINHKKITFTSEKLLQRFIYLSGMVKVAESSLIYETLYDPNVHFVTPKKEFFNEPINEIIISSKMDKLSITFEILTYKMTLFN